jgi:hypothetical protein
MGRSRTCKYKVEEIYGRGTNLAPAVYGADKLPKDIERHVMCNVVSTMPGFINEAVGYQFGITIPALVRYTAQLGPKAGEVVREWKCPAFMVLPDPANYPEVAKHPNPKPKAEPVDA